MVAYRGVLLGVTAGLFALGATAAAAATPPNALDSLESPPAAGSLDWAPQERPAVPTAHERAVTAGERRPTGNPLWAVPLRVLSATRERPIFSPSRRPPAPPVVAAPQAPSPPPPAAKPAEPDHPLLSLVGTVVGEGEGIGVFIEDATHNVLRLHTGQDYSGWVLRAVEGREARFDKNDRSARLALPAPGGSDSAGGPMLAGASSSPANLGGPPVNLGSPLAVTPASAAGNTWMDGDGQMIAPPPKKISTRGSGAIPPQNHRAD
jgi:hypothetical protein